jgi:hypothetical protein
MSTRSTTHFVLGERPRAIVYRHADGYPSGAGADLLEFLRAVQAQTPDTRFGDPSYLAAKYVVFLAEPFAVDYEWTPDEVKTTPRANRLNFNSVGVCLSDPADIEYRYVVDCATRLGPQEGLPFGRPSIRVEHGYGDTWADLGEIRDVLAIGDPA